MIAIIKTDLEDYSLYVGVETLQRQEATYPTVRDAESAAMLAARAAGVETIEIKRQPLSGRAITVGTATASGIMTYTAGAGWSDDDDRAAAQRSRRMSASLNRYADGAE